MPPKNHDLHGNVPDTAAVAFLLIDFINDFEFEDGKALFRHALPAARRTAALQHRVRDVAIPIIYVNDNFGKWQSDFSKLITHCLEDNVRGRPIVELLQPTDDDYFVLKPKQSGFYASTLDILLDYLHVETLIITGVAGNICILFTAHDAYMRDLHLIIPADCIASKTVQENTSALKHMKNVLKADIRLSADLDIRGLKRKAD
jgi:nicotinamidase-related amidase